MKERQGWSFTFHANGWVAKEPPMLGTEEGSQWGPTATGGEHREGRCSRCPQPWATHCQTTPLEHQFAGFCILAAETNARHCTQNVSETVCLPIFQFYYSYKQTEKEMRNWERRGGGGCFSFLIHAYTYSWTSTKHRDLINENPARHSFCAQPHWLLQISAYRSRPHRARPP